MDQVIAILKDTSHAVWGFVSEVGPRLAAATIVMVAGLLVARVVKAALFHGLKAVRFESLANTLGMTNILRRAEIDRSAGEIVCGMIYWTMLVFTIVATLGTAGIVAQGALMPVFEIIPKVVIAIAILVLGINVSAFVAKMVQTAAVNAEIRQARLLRNATHFGVSTLVVLLAVRQLGVPVQLLEQSFLIFFGGTCLALGLSFGLGCKELAASIANSTWRHEKEQTQSLSEASELGNEVFPQNGRKTSRTRSIAA